MPVVVGIDPCALTNFLANDYALAVNAINRKFNALRRLGELLEQLGDISGIFPNISALIPLYQINLDAYNNLVTACPFLKLPKNPTNEDIAALQALVASAYQRLINQLLQHPWLKMGRLQAQLDKVHAKLNTILNEGAQFLQCLQQACASADAAATFVANVAGPQLQGQLDQYSKTYLGNNGQVLTTRMQTKVDTVNGGIDNINTLLQPQPVTGRQSNTPQISPVPNAPQIPIPPAT